MITDPYLDSKAAFYRLLDEYQKYNSLIVCVDFDDTLYDFHKAGYRYDKIQQLVRDLYELNCYIIIWTGNQDTKFIKDYLKENNVPYNSINDEAPVSKKLLGDKIPRKIYSNVYIDDRAGLFQVYNDLTLLVSTIKQKQNK